MLPAIQSVAALLFGAGILILGNGLVSIILPVRMAVEGLRPEISGLVMSSYYAGLVIGCFYAQRLIGRVGHIRAFAAFAAVICATTLAFPLKFDAVTWTLLRCAGGFCMAGLFATIESWLNTRSSNEARGQILSIYMVVAYLASGASQFLVNTWEVHAVQLFCLAALLLSASLVPVVMTHVEGPDLSHTQPLSFARLYQISPLGVAGCFGAGLMGGGFYGMGAVFAQQIGFTVFEVSLFMGLTIAGGLLLQWPIGRLSDRFDRRTVLVGVLLATTAICLIQYLLALAGWVSVTMLLVLNAIFGGLLATVYPIAVAHAFDYVQKDNMVAASSGMLLAWAVGATAAPLLAAFAMGAIGPWALFLYLASTAALLAAFAAYRMRQRQALPSDEQSTFHPRAETTVVHGKLDPRVDTPEQRAAA